MSSVVSMIDITGLRVQHLRQLQNMIEDQILEGSYYGRKDYYDKRSKELSFWIERVIRTVDGQKIREK